VARAYGDTPLPGTGPRIEQQFAGLAAQQPAQRSMRSSGGLAPPALPSNPAARPSMADTLRATFGDTGTGMTQEVMEKIFEPFFSTKELGKGTGLGLSMVYGIIKQTGGYIYPESEIGKGTTFRLLLPRHVPVEKEEVVRAIGAAPVRDLTGNERILLVEDEESVRMFSARALSTTGYEVFEAGSGEEALEVLEEINGEVDLIISDVVMPEMDGPTLLTHVRKLYPGLKVIFVSGYAEESVRQGLEDDRSVEFLPKPYTLDQINSKVKEVLSGAPAANDD